MNCEGRVIGGVPFHSSKKEETGLVLTGTTTSPFFIYPSIEWSLLCARHYSGIQ